MRYDEQVRQRMFSMISSWKLSGLSQKAYCEQNDIRYYVFHYWYKRYCEAHNTSADNTSSFIPLHINTSLSSAAGTELIYPDGRRLLFYQSVDVNFLKSLLG